MLDIYPNVEPVRRECASVEVAQNVELSDPVFRLTEVKQEQLSPSLWMFALSNKRMKSLFYVVLVELSGFARKTAF